MKTYKSKYNIDPLVERQAKAIVDRLGDGYLLDGACIIGGGDFRIMLRDREGKLSAQIHPINVDLRHLNQEEFSNNRERLEKELLIEGKVLRMNEATPTRVIKEIN